MVDFNAEATTSTPIPNLIKIVILEKRYNLFEAVEKYLGRHYQNIEVETYEIKARLNLLFFELQALFKRKLSDEEYNKLIEDLQKDDFETIKKTIFLINHYLDEWNVIKIDTRKKYDSTDIETENKEKNL
jgi:hypothetical protein